MPYSVLWVSSKFNFDFCACQKLVFVNFDNIVLDVVLTVQNVIETFILCCRSYALTQ